MREDPISIDNSVITVIVNDIPIQVPKDPINLRAFFGDDALLLHSSGHSVLVNDWGFTIEGLEDGATYFLVISFAIYSFRLYIYRISLSSINS